VYSWVRDRPFESDALATLAIAVPFVLIPQALGGSPSRLIVGLGLIVPLAWRRSHPVTTAATIAVFGLLQLAVTQSLMIGDVAVLAALYSLAAYAPGWANRSGLALALIGGPAAALRFYPTSARYLTLMLGFVATLVLSTWSLGMMRRLRLRDQDRLTERARLLELERDQEGRLAATAERARIAREMHDVVAHSLSVTISQADGGRYAAGNDPQAAIAALETISVTGRQALADMRALLGVLRQDEGHQLSPQPDTDTIPDLIEQVRSSGLDVSLQIAGRARKLPPGPALAAYRIVQESLTNVLKHAGPNRRAWVRINWRPDQLEISIVDDGRGAGAVGGSTDGQGVLGMHERAVLHGGTLHAGPRPGGGFIVQALLPYRETH